MEVRFYGFLYELVILKSSGTFVLTLISKILVLMITFVNTTLSTVSPVHLLKPFDSNVVDLYRATAKRKFKITF